MTLSLEERSEAAFRKLLRKEPSASLHIFCSINICFTFIYFYQKWKKWKLKSVFRTGFLEIDSFCLCFGNLWLAIVSYMLGNMFSFYMLPPTSCFPPCNVCKFLGVVGSKRMMDTIELALIINWNSPAS